MTQPAGDEGKTTGELSSKDRAQLKRRLSELGDRLGKARSSGKAKNNGEQGRHGIGYAFRMAFDMVASVVVAGAIGWFLDHWLGTAPVLLLVLGALGIAAGFMNVARTYRQMADEMYKAAKGQSGQSMPIDDED